MPDPNRYHRAVQRTVLLLAAIYAAWFGVYTCIQHERFKTWAFDLGTFDQGIWLAGHGTNYFVTVRGLPLLGDHVRIFSFVLAPLYWIVDDVRALLVLQSVAIAAGAFFLCRIVLRLVPSRPLVALALSAGFLLHPANQNLNLDHAHPDAFAMTFILASLDFLGAGRIVAFAAAAALAMSCKEDVPLVFAALGATMMLDPKRRRLGFTVGAASSLYFLLCVAVILPSLNGAGFFRFGQGGFLAGLAMRGHEPGWILERLFRPESVRYLLEIGLANLYLFLLAPLQIVPALPALAANLLSDANYMRDLEFHYQTSIVPFLFVGTASAIASLDALRLRLASSTVAGAKRGLAGLGSSALRIGLAVAPIALLVAAVGSNLGWSRVPISDPGILRKNRMLLHEDWRNASADRVLASIPADAVVAADYSSVPHLSHRRRIYMFPNPFDVSYWGVDGEHPDDPVDVEYIVLRKERTDDAMASRMDQLVAAGSFHRIGGDEFIALYKRIDVIPVSPHASCADIDGDGRVSEEDQRYIGLAIMRGRDCPLHVCDADGNGKLEYRDALVVGRRARDPAVPLSCPPAGAKVD